MKTFSVGDFKQPDTDDTGLNFPSFKPIQRQATPFAFSESSLLRRNNRPSAPSDFALSGSSDFNPNTLPGILPVGTDSPKSRAFEGNRRRLKSRSMVQLPSSADVQRQHPTAGNLDLSFADFSSSTEYSVGRKLSSSAVGRQASSGEAHSQVAPLRKSFSRHSRRPNGGG